MVLTRKNATNPASKMEANSPLATISFFVSPLLGLNAVSIDIHKQKTSLHQALLPERMSEQGAYSL